MKNKENKVDVEQEIKEEMTEEKVIENEEATFENREMHETDATLASKLAEIEELKSKLMYKEAEFINFRKRKDEEVAGMLRYANQDLILEIIKSVDNFERAIDSIKKDDEADNEKMLTGINMIYQELKTTLQKFGVSEVSEIGVPFDEAVHHAVMVENDEEKPDGFILEVMIKGYKLHERVIRPAMVKVNQL